MFNLPIFRDVLETGSALVVPNVNSFGIVATTPHGGQPSFFAAVPLTAGSITIGALCWVDEQPRRIGEDGFAVLRTMARRASAVLSARDSAFPPLFTKSNLLSREGLLTVLSVELARARFEHLGLALFAFAGRPKDVTRSIPRTAIADLENGHYVAFAVRTDAHAAREEVGHLAHDRPDLRGGLVTFETGTDWTFDAREVLLAAEDLLSRAAPGTVEHLMLRRNHEVLKGHEI
jgi:hypothetical protein